MIGWLNSAIQTTEGKEDVLLSEAKNLEYINVDVFEILPPFGRLNGTEGEITISLTSNVR